MIKNTPPKYAVTFYVETDSQEVLKAALEYVMRRMSIGWVSYSCGPQACICRGEVEWDNTRLTVKTCTERAAHAVAKLLVRAYTWLGGKLIQVVKYEEQTL